MGELNWPFGIVGASSNSCLVLVLVLQKSVYKVIVLCHSLVSSVGSL